MIGYNMEQNFNLYSKNEIAKFEDSYYNISICEYNNLQFNKTTKSENTIGPMDKLIRYSNLTSLNRERLHKLG